MNFTPTLANIMDLNFPHGETGQLNAFSKYILMDTGLIGFLNHKFYGKCHTHTHNNQKKPFCCFNSDSYASVKPAPWHNTNINATLFV